MAMWIVIKQTHQDTTNSPQFERCDQHKRILPNKNAWISLYRPVVINMWYTNTFQDNKKFTSKF
jgi:hypothetical protein